MNCICNVIEATQTSHFLGRLFLNSVLSAILGLGLLLLVACYVFVEFFIDPTMLRSDRHFDGTSSASVEHPVNQPAYPSMGLDSVVSLTDKELHSLLLQFIFLQEYLCSAGWNVFPYRANCSSYGPCRHKIS